MKCDSAAEFASALCDGEVIPQDAAEHIGGCAECQERLRDLLTIGVELRSIASLEMRADVPARDWSKPLSRVERWWQKGWGTMRIPKLAFASMFLVIMGLAASLLVVKVGARSNGTAVLLTTSGPSGLILDRALSTVDPKQASFVWFGKAGDRLLAYGVKLDSREGSRVLLEIRAHAYPNTPGEHNFDIAEFDSEAARKLWFEPGEPLTFDVPDLGTLTLTGEWLDHMPNMLEVLHIDHLFPGPNEIRFGRPLLLKDGRVVGDFANVIGGFYNQQDTKDLHRTAGFYLPGEGRFLISPLPMKGAVQAQVAMGRISFEEGGHSWEFLSGVPVYSADHLWVLHQADFRMRLTGSDDDHVAFSNPPLVQSEPGVWVPEAR